MTDDAPAFLITNEDVVPVGNRVLEPLLERIEDGGDPVHALAAAFIEGARFAGSELVAQLIEAGIDVQVTIELTPAGGDSS